jgi:hypothetical protein
LFKKAASVPRCFLVKIVRLVQSVTGVSGVIVVTGVSTPDAVGKRDRGTGVIGKYEK